MVAGVVEHHGAFGTTGHRHCGREQSVVGTDEHTCRIGDFDRDERSSARRTGIDGGEHHTRRHVPDRPRQREAARPHVVRRHLVGEVHHLRVRSEIADDRGDHTDGLVDPPEVAEERDGVEATAHARVNLPEPVGALQWSCAQKGEEGRCQPPDGTNPLRRSPCGRVAV